jgi:single-stranded DNA-binding protein
LANSNQTGAIWAVSELARLTRDPEMRSLASGKSVTQFAVATNAYASGKENAEYQSTGKV